MKILLLGATGRTGKELVKQALAMGYEVTAVVRDPSKMTLRQHKLHVLQGDAKDVALLTKAAKGQDAILSALGISAKNADYGLMVESAKAIIAAARVNKVKRVVIMSTFMAAQNQLRPLSKLLTKTIGKKVIADVHAAERLYEKADIDWTFIYAVGLSNKDKTGQYRVASAREKVSIMHRIARADVAAFMLDQLNDRTHAKKTVLLTGKM